MNEWNIQKGNLITRVWTQGPEEMCLSLEHQNPWKTSEKMGYLDRVTVQFRYTFYIPQTKRLRARRIGLQYKKNDKIHVLVLNSAINPLACAFFKRDSHKEKVFKES